MPIKQIIFLGVVFLIALTVVLRMIVTHRLREVYAVVWMIVVMCIPLYILFYPLLQKLSILMGISSPVHFLIILGFTVLFILTLHFSALNSGMQRRLKNTLQKLTLLEEEIQQLKKKIDLKNH